MCFSEIHWEKQEFSVAPISKSQSSYWDSWGEVPYALHFWFRSYLSFYFLLWQLRSWSCCFIASSYVCKIWSSYTPYQWSNIIFITGCLYNESFGRYRYCHGDINPKQLQFETNFAGKPYLITGEAYDSQHGQLHFNLTHTSSLLGTFLLSSVRFTSLMSEPWDLMVDTLFHCKTSKYL